jgi:hypothetical protein
MQMAPQALSPSAQSTPPTPTDKEFDCHALSRKDSHFEAAGFSAGSWLMEA